MPCADWANDAVDGADGVDSLHDVAGDPGEQRENQKVTSKKLKQTIAFPVSLVAHCCC